MSIDDRDASAQVTALRQENEFLYLGGGDYPMQRYLRSDCITKGGPFANPIQ